MGGFPDWVVILQFLGIVLLGIISYFLKHSLDDLDTLEDKVQALEVDVAVLLDRDRRNRLAEYERERIKRLE